MVAQAKCETTHSTYVLFNAFSIVFNNLSANAEVKIP